MIKFNRYPGGKPHALTMSYDDGRNFDRQLIDIFNRHGLKGSFHLNSGFFDTQNYVTSAEIADLYQGHEVSCHTLTHPFLEKIPMAEVVNQILADKENLEELAGYPVRGMSYPFGTYNEEVINALRICGMEYSRTTQATMNWNMPDDFMRWHPSCHHKACLELLDKFEATLKNRPHAAVGAMLYVWGHSYEFNNDQNWDLMEEFASRIGGREDFWYATNIEIVDYQNALKSLRFSRKCDLVTNPSAISVWIEVDGTPMEVKPGETKKL